MWGILYEVDRRVKVTRMGLNKTAVSFFWYDSKLYVSTDFLRSDITRRSPVMGKLFTIYNSKVHVRFKTASTRV